MTRYQVIHDNIAKWYDAHGRKNLPWRNTADPYHIYVSEIMLQQTQVKTVLEKYYFPFLEKFPTLQALADADLQEVLKAWEGLGYYTRARNLHKAAQICAPNLPDNFDELIALSGIGKNTAHAILAFSHKKPVSIMEANVKRILCRVFALKKPEIQALWNYSQKLLNNKEPFDYNQAMMDIGATVCTPKNPACFDCPLAEICKGKDSPEKYPEPKAAKKEKVRNKIIIVFIDPQKRIFLTRREGRFLHGYYGFHEIENTNSNKTITSNYKPYFLSNIKQIYTHFTLKAEVYISNITIENSKGEWHSLNTVKSLPLSKADQKVLALIERLD